MHRFLLLAATFLPALPASTIFLPGTSAWTFDQNGDNALFSVTSNSSSVTQLPSQNGVAGVKASGSGGVTKAGNSTLYGPGFTTVLLEFVATGTFSGDPFASGSVPLHYDITVSSSSTSPFSASWAVGLLLDDAYVLLDNGFAGNNPNGNQITGNINFTPLANYTYNHWKLIVDASVGLKLGESLAVSIPSNSIDINPVTGSAVPEPSEGLLFMAGLTLIGFARKALRHKEHILSMTEHQPGTRS